MNREGPESYDLGWELEGKESSEHTAKKKKSIIINIRVDTVCKGLIALLGLIKDGTNGTEFLA